MWKNQHLTLIDSGNGESGKSTVIKQMRLIHASGFDASERESFRVIVFANIVLAMQILLEIVEQLHIPLQHESYTVSYPYSHMTHSC